MRAHSDTTPQREWNPVFHHVPDCTNGDWEIKTSYVSSSESKCYNLNRKTAMPGMLRYIRPGIYQSLLHGGRVVMSDTPTELADCDQFIRMAFGRVLVTGLGLGIVPRLLLMSDDITSVTVVEKNKHVIDLVAPHIADSRFHVVHADVFDWMPDEAVAFDFAWHNIWPAISDKNILEMNALVDRFAHVVGIDQCCWAMGCCENMWQSIKMRLGTPHFDHGGAVSSRAASGR